MLRPHTIFEHPLTVDLDQSRTIPTPDAWTNALEGATVSILPLVPDAQRTHQDGWCTYTYEHVQAPELEIICGGVNAKTPQASAIWRQGNLLHFGFEQSPAEMNESGDSLLVNSICYISRFTEDRPIVRTPGGSYSGLRRVDRDAVDRLINNKERDLNAFLDWLLGGEAREAARGKSREELADWYQKHRGYLYSDARGKFVLDEDALEFGIPIDSEEFIPSAIEAWRAGGEQAVLAHDLLGRYVTQGPDTHSAQDWLEWWNSNRSYLFFSDTAGCQWLIDPLAKKREAPTSDLRGEARATLPAVTLK